MNIKTTLKTIAIGMFALVATAANASTLQEIKDATYKLYLNEDAGCSGQFVTEDKFLTAAHCVGNNEYGFNIRDKTSGKIYFLKLGKVDKKIDEALFLVETQHAPFTYVDVIDKDFFGSLIGVKVIAAGYPEVEEFRFTEGFISEYNTVSFSADGVDFENIPDFTTSIPIAPGSSGGGLYYEKNGEYYLIGTTSAQYYGHDWMSYFTTPQSIHGILD